MNHFRLALLISIISTFYSKTEVWAQPGTLDTTFSIDGLQTTFMQGSGSTGKAIVLQPDGKIVMAGYSGDSGNYDFALARYLTDGALDTTFGTGGIVTTDVAGAQNSDRLHAVSIQTDGRLVVAGETYNGTDYDFVVARYLPNGIPDPSFGINGITVLPIGTGTDVAHAVKAVGNGRILAAGYGTFAGSEDMVLMRLDSMGNADPTFDFDGMVTVDFSGDNDRCYGLAVQIDNKVVLAGYSYFAPGNQDFALARFFSDGSVDNSFDFDGKVTTDFGTNDDAGLAVAINNNGRIIVAGSSGIYAGVAQYRSSGGADSTFSTDGRDFTTVGSVHSIAYAVAVQIDNKIVLGGLAQFGNQFEYALIRYNTNGTYDTSFDIDGKVSTDFAGDDDVAYGIAIQTDGKIILAGTILTGTDYDWSLARYESQCPVVTFTQSPVICSGEIFYVGTNAYVLGGVYTDIFVLPNGCDSVVTTILTVLPIFTSLQTLTINSGDSVVVGTSVYTITGIYTDTLTAINGCDSIVVTILTVLTGIETIPGAVSHKIFPNPFSNNFYITDTDEAAVVILYDLTGREIFRQHAVSGETLVSPGSLEPGHYLLTYLHKGDTFQGRVVKF